MRTIHDDIYRVAYVNYLGALTVSPPNLVFDGLTQAQEYLDKHATHGGVILLVRIGQLTAVEARRITDDGYRESASYATIFELAQWP